MINDFMLSIIIPAKNSETFIKKTVNDILREFKKEDIELIVVCNDCRDNTYAECSGFSKTVKVLNFPNKIGKGGAIIKGFLVSKGEIVGYTDSDGAYTPKYIRRLFDEISKENRDVVIASRWIGKKFNQVEGNIWRKIYGRMWFFMVKNLIGLKIKDTQAGLKFFKRYVLTDIIDNIRSTDFSFDLELLLKIKNRGYNIVQIPVKEQYVKKSTVNLLSILNMSFSLVKIRLRSNFQK
ncbi:hypothetical protein COY26_00010 [Candidatus Woesearchaeota archaeon CG_4_10_14_0_2_um_filter_33_10]|nr:MAG: hypothetical protein COY26_00010 [Candidatus Woesearchaeota archaeon CG_4_10_14_0_2_um_filter_33_10]